MLDIYSIFIKIDGKFNAFFYDIGHCKSASQQ